MSADATGVETGIAAAKKAIATMGPAAAAAGKQAAAGLGEVGAGGATAAKKVESATQNMIGSIQRTAAAMEAGDRSSSKYFETLARQRGIDPAVLRPYLAQLDEAKKKQDEARKALEGTKKPLNDLGMTAGQVTAAMRGVPAQFTDIITSIQGGQKPISVLLQQGGQLKDMFGGIGPAARALGGYILGLINPYTLAAAAIGGLAYVAYSASEESKELRRSLQLTGNYAGLTEDKFRSLGDGIAQATNSSVGSSRELLQALVSSGAYTGEALTETAKAAQLFGKATGQSLDEVIKNFQGMRNGAAKWAEDTNRQYHFLTAAQLQYIRTLDAQGKSQEAITVTMKALSEGVRGAAADVSTLDAYWTKAKNSASDYWAAVKGFVGTQTVDQRLAAAQERLAGLNSATPQQHTGLVEGIQSIFGGEAFLKKQKEETEDLIRTLTARKEFVEGSASADAKRAQLEEARDVRQKVINENLSKQLQLEKELSQINAVFDSARVPGEKDDADNERRRLEALQHAREKFYVAPPAVEFAAGVDRIKNSLTALTGAYSDAESILDAVRSAGLVADSDYYAAKRAYIEINARAQADAFRDENAKARAEIARTEVERSKGLKKEEADARIAALNKSIADNSAKSERAKNEASAKGEVLRIQERASVEQLNRLYKESRQVAEAYLQTLTLQGQRDAAAVGKSDNQRNFDAGRDQINDRFEQSKRQIENERELLEQSRRGAGLSVDEEKGFADRLSVQREFQAASLAQWKDSYTKIRAEEAKWENGAKRAFDNYVDNAANAAKTAESFFSRTFNSIEDALTEFVRTGRLDFKAFAQSVIADLIRIQVQAEIAGIFKLLGFGASGAGTASTGAELSANAGLPVGTFAEGGDPPVGRASIVGERGPELFVPKSAGTIIPNHKLGGQTINFSPVYNVAAGVSRNELIAALRAKDKNDEARMNDKLRRAGIA